MILIVLFILSLFVWLGASMFEVRTHWTDIVTQIAVPIGGDIENFVVPGIGLLIFLVVSNGILYLTNTALKASASGAVSKIHLKDTSHTLAIQSLGSSLYTDSMNENIEPTVAWLPLRLSRWVIGFFLYKLIVGLVLFVLAVVVPIIAALIGYSDVGSMIAEILKQLSFWLLRLAMNVNGMVMFGYAITVVYAYSLYAHERIFIRDYAIMQQQIASK